MQFLILSFKLYSYSDQKLLIESFQNIKVITGLTHDTLQIYHEINMFGDNMDIFIPYAFKMNEQFYTIDKENPGVYIKVN